MRSRPVPSFGPSQAPCSEFVKRAQSAYEAWGEVLSSLRACFINVGGPDDPALDPFELLRVVAAARSQSSIVNECGEPLLLEIEKQAREAMLLSVQVFDREFRHLCSRESVLVDGRFPNYNLDGFLVVRLNVDQGICRIGTKEIRTLMVRRVWGYIAVELKAEKQRQIPPSEFLSLCESAYTLTITARNEQPGNAIPVRELFKALQSTRQKERLHGGHNTRRERIYAMEHFKRDLGKLMASGEFVATDGARMEFLPTAFAKEGIAVAAGEGVRYIGKVAFRQPSR